METHAILNLVPKLQSIMTVCYPSQSEYGHYGEPRTSQREEGVPSVPGKRAEKDTLVREG